MKKALLVLMALMLIVTVAVAPGCKKTTQTPETTQKVKVTLYVNGTLGDKSFFDSAERGFQQAISELNIDGKTVEGGYDPSKWQPDLEQIAQGDSEVIIVGTTQITDVVTAVAPKYPNKKFIVYDTTVDFTKANLSNVYCMTYKQNEGSFLAGALAALITESNMPLANPDKVIGFLGGMDIPVINDFKVGYVQGAHYIDPEVKVLVSYAGSFNDPAKGKELVLAQYAQGADIAFNVAGGTGIGLLDAAKEANKYAIGVDSDQYEMFKDKDPAEAANIVTSMLKNVDKSIYRALDLYLKGQLPFGQTEALGIKEDGIGIVDNENYQKLVPQEIRDKIEELKQKVTNGEITIETAFGS
jgi:basic membrane protein A